MGKWFIYCAKEARMAAKADSMSHCPRTCDHAIILFKHAELSVSNMNGAFKGGERLRPFCGSEKKADSALLINSRSSN